MRYTKQERLDIGRRIYHGELSNYQAAREYGISAGTARDYMRLYRDANQLPPKTPQPGYKPEALERMPHVSDPDLDEYQSMTKEELIRELVRSKIREARLKKGYEVKGVGAEKVFIPLDSKNTK